MRWQTSLGMIAMCAALAACGQQPTTAAPNTAGPAASTTTATPTQVQAGGVPAHIGDCVETTVSEISSRLEGMPTSGSAVTFANGIYQVSYDMVDAITHSHVGDPIHLCLVSLPENCPPGDDRGKTYQATNARTHESWNAADAEHMCGGA